MQTLLESMSPQEGKDAIRALLTELTEHIDFAIHSLTSGEGVGAPEKLAEKQKLIRTIFLMIQGVGIDSLHRQTHGRARHGHSRLLWDREIGA